MHILAPPGRAEPSARPFLIAVALVTVGAAACTPAGPVSWLDGIAGADTRGRNIVLVLSDTHRLDYTSGYPTAVADPTPRVAELARRGAVFTAASTPVPISAPAYATLMTGRLPIEHGLLNNQQHLAEELPLLQEDLQRAGYRTAAVVANPFCSAGHGFARGFDHFWDRVDGRGKEGEIVTDEAIAWLDTDRSEAPFFLFLAYMDAHVPYIADGIPPSLRIELDGARVADLLAENSHVEQRIRLELRPGPNRIDLRFLDRGAPATPPGAPSPLHVTGLRLASGRTLARNAGVDPVPDSRFERLDNQATLTVDNPDSRTAADELVFRCYRKYRPERIPAFYEAGVRSFDRSFGRLLEALERRGLWDEAIVIFVSDHGEMLGEHDAWGHVEHLWQESLRIPLIVRVPGLPGDVREQAAFDLRDLHDLVLALARGPAAGWDRGIRSRRQRPFVAATFPPEAGSLQVAVVGDRLKVIAAADGTIRAFDLEADPGETDDLLDGGVPSVRLEDLAATARRELAAAAEADSLELDGLSDAELDRLRALGYLDPGS